MTTVQVFLEDPHVRLLLAGAAAVAVLVGVLSARAGVAQAALGVAAAFAVLGVASVTLNRAYGYDGPPGGEGGPLSVCMANLSGIGLGDLLPAGSDGRLNVALFVPAGVLLALATRRPVLSALALCAWSAVIEGTQTFLPGHSCDRADWSANCLGAVLGATAGGLLLLLARTLRRSRDRSATSSGADIRENLRQPV